MGRFKLTPLAKKGLAVVALAAVVGGLAYGGVFSKAKNEISGVFKVKPKKKLTKMEKKLHNHYL